MASSSKTSSIRKAAVLIRSLDADSTARLLAQLRPEESQALREAIRNLGAVDDDELFHVAAELQAPRKSKPTSPQPEVVLELSGEIPVDIPVPNSAPRTELRFNSQLAELRHLAANAHNSAPFFQSLLTSETQSLAEFLNREHSQTIAVVLSYLPATKAAEVLGGLADERQADVVQRLADLRDADADTLRVVEHGLEVWLAEQRREKLRHSDRMSIVGSILTAAKASARQAILLRLQTRDGQLARQIERQIAKPDSISKASAANWESSRELRRRPIGPPEHRGQPWDAPAKEHGLVGSVDPQCSEFAKCSREIGFDDLVQLSKPDLAELMRSIDPRVLCCALAGANEQLLDRVCDTLPRRERKAYRRQVRSFGPVTLRDVDVAQRVVTAAASKIIYKPLKFCAELRPA